MKTLIAGSVAAALGLIGMAVWYTPFLSLLKGSIPVMLLLGGCLALYLGFDELKDSMKNGSSSDLSPVENDKDQEIGDLKKEIEELKSKNKE